MDIIEKKNYYNSLFDFYGCLLTDTQKNYFTDYYFNDLTLSEIATNYNVSRNAIFDQLKKIYHILDNYEEKLQLYSIYLKRNEIYDEYSNLNDEKVLELIQRLKETE